MSDPERLTLVSAGAFRLSALHWRARSAARAALIICHGVAEHARRYAPFAEACAEAGIDVYAHDQRGHGASIDERCPRGHLGDAGGFADLVDDARCVRAQIRAAHPTLPTFLFGHSMGSVVARTLVLRSPDQFAGVIISSTGANVPIVNRLLAGYAQWSARQSGGRAPAERLQKLVFGSFNARFKSARTPLDWLTSDASAVDAYMADPECGFVASRQLWCDVLTQSLVLEAEEPRFASRSLPVLLITGTRDPASMNGLSHTVVAKRYRAAGNANVVDKRYPDGRHEMLNETNKREVFADIISWMDGRLSPRP